MRRQEENDKDGERSMKERRTPERELTEKERRRRARRRQQREKKRAAEQRRRGKKKQSIMTTLVLAVAVCVFLFSAFQLYKIFSGYKEGDDEYKDLKKRVITENKNAENEAERFEVDFEELRKINPDVIGWIRFEEPSIINYPVVHSKDNKEYLTKLFGEGKNTYGTIFVDKDNKGDFSDKNTFIYGHYMKSGSMFGQLNKYDDYEFYRNHPYFYIYTPDGKVSTYEVYSAGVVKDTSDSYIKVYENEEAFQKYIDLTKEASNYETEAEVTKDSSIVSLSTCTRASNEDRFLLHGVKIRED